MQNTGDSTGSANPDGARSQLLELLRTLSYRRGTVTLASGKTSDFFIDCKQTVLTAEGHALVGELMLAAIADEKFDAVACVELGGCPLASAVALTSALRKSPLDAIYVRKEAKDHGSQKLVEGGTRLAKGARIALLEDVVTTGGSTLKAAEKLAQSGFVVARVVALVDRLEGGRQAIESAGFAFASLYSKTDFLA
ncbi:MAG: orotate phosphoribosyltransferase [Polyangiaceae bacterium]